MMASMCLSLSSTSIPLSAPPLSPPAAAAASSSASQSSLAFNPLFGYGGRLVSAVGKRNRSRRRKQAVCMAPDEEKLTRRNPLDFPIEWERPKPGRRPDIFPQFSPMKTPIPPPLPYDPPEEDEEEEEEKKKEEEEEDPEKEEEPDKPEKQ